VGEEREHRVGRFEQAMKAWAERPSRLSPEQAGRRVVEAARRRRRRAGAVGTLLATAALLAVALTFGVPHGGPLSETRTPAAPPVAAAPLGAGQALIWLDAETPLYMTFEAPGTAPGGRP
jgi:ferric-dicitrate binding protein FerR (iron transport regulator)